MKKKKTLILVLQLFLLVATAFSFMTYTQNEVKPQTVYVFNKDLNVNEKITSADVKKVTVPKSAVTSDFALDPKSFIDKYVGVKVLAGTFIYKQQIIEEGQKDPFASMDLSQYRKISLPISYVDGFGGNLKRGDHVDLVFEGEGSTTDSKGTEQKFQYAKTFLQDVLVYNVTTSNGYEFVDHSSGDQNVDANGQKIDTSSTSDEMAVVTLAVKLDEAEEITARQSAGKIRLVARFDQNESYETLGFVLGDYEKVFSAPANAETSRSTVDSQQ